MSARLKWDGDRLMLGKTKMAEIMRVMKQGKSSGHDVETFRYVLGPDDHVSEPYQSKEDARQDCERHVRELLVKAGAIS